VRIADGKRELKEIWLHLTPDEAREMIDSLTVLLDELGQDPGNHAHVTDARSEQLREVTLYVFPNEDTQQDFERWFEAGMPPEDSPGL
jgi:hypothetical protein